VGKNFLALLVFLFSASPSQAFFLDPFVRFLGCELRLAWNPETFAFKEALVRVGFIYSDYPQKLPSDYSLSASEALRFVLQQKEPYSSLVGETRARLVYWALDNGLRHGPNPDYHVERVSNWLIEELKGNHGYSRSDLEKIEKAFQKHFSGRYLSPRLFARRRYGRHRELEEIEVLLAVMMIQRTTLNELENEWSKRLSAILRGSSRVPKQPGALKIIVEEFCKLLLQQNSLGKEGIQRHLVQWTQSLSAVNSLHAQEVIDSFKIFQSAAIQSGLSESEADPIFQSMLKVASSWPLNSTAQESVQRIVNKGIKIKALQE
jgi:hypothetical protein